ncbi:hypothetical protein [Streptomyces sp. NPDC046727]|uniref:hypothetical protein n=1 Tax=Streptomyces sp. NPDC046727 TaxID=3155373 RepID=UPI0033DC4A6B
MSHFVRRVFRLSYTRRPVDDSKTCGGQHGLTCAAPRLPDDGAGEDAAVLALEQQITRLKLLVCDVLPQDAGQGRMPRHSARLALGSAFQVALLVDLPVSVHCFPISGVAVWISSSHH